MTGWELPAGYGRVKPDLVTFGEGLQGASLTNGCSTMSGTSVSSPVIAGVVAALANFAKPRGIFNPATVRQVMLESAEQLPNASIFEQGAGRLSVPRMWTRLQNYVPRASAFPASLDLTACPYFWPYCAQPLFATGQPAILNVTILNGMGVVGMITEVSWLGGASGDNLGVELTYDPLLWPWSGWLGVRVAVAASAASFLGTAEGIISVSITSPPGPHEPNERLSIVEIPLRVAIVPTPDRERRVLWDQFHSLRYPPSFIPKDSFGGRSEPFDAHGDHPHTNYRSLFRAFKAAGYYLEVLSEPLTCFDASNYGTLFIVDPEAEFSTAERDKLESDIRTKSLNLVLLPDWYNLDLIASLEFYDENTKQTWVPATGGSNLPALNDLLSPFDISFGHKVWAGPVYWARRSFSFLSGTSLNHFPAGGSLFLASLLDESVKTLQFHTIEQVVPIIGIFQATNTSGRIAILTDSSCADDLYAQESCLGAVLDLVDFAATGTTLPESAFHKLTGPFRSETSSPPLRLPYARLEEQFHPTCTGLVAVEFPPIEFAGPVGSMPEIDRGQYIIPVSFLVVLFIVLFRHRLNWLERRARNRKAAQSL